MVQLHDYSLNCQALSFFSTRMRWQKKGNSSRWEGRGELCRDKQCCETRETSQTLRVAAIDNRTLKGFNIALMCWRFLKNVCDCERRPGLKWFEMNGAGVCGGRGRMCGRVVTRCKASGLFEERKWWNTVAGGREREINDCKEKMRQEKGDVGLGETETEEISLN